MKNIILLLLLSLQSNAYLLSPLLKCENKELKLTVNLENDKEGFVQVGKKTCRLNIFEVLDSPRATLPTSHLLFKIQKKCHADLFLKKGFMIVEKNNDNSIMANILVLKNHQTLKCKVTEKKTKKLEKAYFSN